MSAYQREAESGRRIGVGRVGVSRLSASSHIVAFKWPSVSRTGAIKVPCI